MQIEMHEGSGFFRHLCRLCVVVFTILGTTIPGMGQPSQNAQNISNNKSTSFTTTVEYMVHFYPLWYSYHAFQIFNAFSGASHLGGPIRMSPLFRFLQAPNVDTVYAASFLNLTTEPAILTIPETTVTYSILAVDPYFDVFDPGIPPQTPGVYALVGPGYSGSLPAGITPIKMPVNFPIMFFRSDKFSRSGESQIKQARKFRSSLKMQPLSDYIKDASAGSVRLVPVVAFFISLKNIADRLISRNPIGFLQQLQEAVASPNTPPLSSSERELSDRFDALFGTGENQSSDFSDGAKAAFKMIVNEYLNHTDATNWIHYANTGDWGDNFIERAAGAEFLGPPNGVDTTLYFQVFQDGSGAPLDGSNSAVFVMTFRKGKIPRAQRFWSVTAYTPDAENLIQNPLHKYHVANYTPGLVVAPDGSISIYLAHQLPEGVPLANWIPIPDGPFNLLLRIYGPKGRENETYVPPEIRKR